MLIQVKKLSSSDSDVFLSLIHVFEEVFEMHNFIMPSKQHLEQLLEKESFVVFVALSNGAVVGGLTAYVFDQYYSVSPLVYVYDLAVKTAYQRKGIGKSLISAINVYCQSIGAEEVFVQAEEADGHAVEFYRSTGATEAKVIHFSYLHKK
ncbi:MAG: GCN5-related N-acetyltransferase [Cytophagaceae bacterium]|jgi:ribosomal protein S18 acetylase RimI-like enzyme|nr:GCN5-related N-acetyltransferase [Cytophagaceae bacterium]